MRDSSPVFNIVKLSPAPNDPISRRHWNLPLPLKLIDGEEEYIMEKILNSRMFWWKLQYLVKWKGYGTEENTWEYSENLKHAPEKVMEFHTKNLEAPHHIRTLTFGSIPFHPIPLSSASSRCSPGGGVIVRGTPSAFPPSSASTSASCSSSASAPDLLSNVAYDVTWCHKAYRLQPAITSDLLSACTTLAHHVTLYLTHIYWFWSYSLYPQFCILAHACRWILILSSLDPLLGVSLFSLLIT